MISALPNLAFRGRGSIYAEGTFGGGVVGIYPIATNEAGGQQTESSDYLDDAINGTSIKSIDCPSGNYAIKLTGSTSASVTVFYNDQMDLTIDQ